MENNSTFNLPTLTDGRVVAGTAGSYIGTTTNGQLPNITGTINRAVMYPNNGGTGAFTFSSSSGNIPGPNSGQPKQILITFNAANCSSLYQDGATQVRAASLFMAYCIKY